MWTALEEGVLGGKGYSLMDKVYPVPSLRKAFARVKANGGAAGVDHLTVEEFERHREANREKLSQALQEGRYRPQAIRRVWIPKPGSKEKRPLGIPTVRDRVVPAALRAVLEPSSSGISRRRATDSVRIGAARTRCAGSMPCCRQDTTGW